jgi:Transmembrane domain of unknown function (DUF3566)
MSARESGSDTWPRLAEFPGDNLELGNAPEEDDVDHRGEPPSWVPGTTAVGTGAGPPDLDETDDGQLDNGPMYAAGPEDSDAPGFGDAGAPEFQSGAPEFQGGAPEFHGGPDGMGYGDAPAQAPDFGDGAHEAPDFAAPPMAFGEAHQDGPAAGAIQGDGTGYGDGGYTAGPAAGPGFDEAPAFTGGSDAPPFQAGTPEFQGIHSGFAPQGQQSFDGPGEPAHQGFTEGPQDNDYDGPFTGQFRGDYGAGAAAGYGAAGQDDGSLRTAPGMGDGYSYRTGENGSQGYSSHYPPVEPPQASATARISGVTASLRTRRPRAGKGKGKGKKRDQSGRQAQLTVARVEPWSVMKFSFVISLVAFIVLFVAVAVLYAVLSGLGVFSALQHTVSNITSSQSSGGFNLMTYISASRVLGYTGLLGAINVVLITALSTVGAVLYNITSDLAGGIEITLKESD